MATCSHVRPTGSRSRVRSALLRAAAVLGFVGLVAPTTASAYHYFYLSGSPVAWRTLPIAAIVDKDSASFITTATSALNVWNGVTTAKDMFGTPTTSAVDFTGANYLTAWGMTDDSKFEIICDTDGTALSGLGLSTVDTLGYGPSVKKVVGGQSAITDGYFILNCKVPASADFSYLGTMVHELGHDLGLAHTPVYQGSAASAGSLEAVAAGDAPTMYPFSIPGNDAASATLEADDKAGISALYPDTTFATSYGTLSGTVTRCTTNEVVKGAIVRAVSTSSNIVQITRYSSYDANATGRFDISVPTGTYHLLIEVLQLAPARMAMQTAVDKDFDQEYYNPPDEPACTEDLPDTAVNVTATAGASTGSLDFKTNAAEVAFVVDDTGSMGNDIAGVRSILTNQINRLKAITTKPFPMTAIVSFKDNVTVRKVSRDPAVLQTIVSALVASGGGDCPEHSNDALLVAGKLLRKGGTAMLFTDADSHADGASSADVSSLYREKSLRLSTLLSGSCSESLSLTAADAAGTTDASRFNPALSNNPPTAWDGSAPPSEDRAGPPTPLGTESSIKTFSTISSSTGGFFTAIPGIKSTSNTVETARYINTGTNVAVSATVPTVGLVSPGDAPLGSTLDLLITGSSTNFQGTSTVSFGAGITVNSVTVLSGTQLRPNITVSSSATTGFRDVTVTTTLGSSTETATGVGALNITTAPTSATVISTLPATGAPGTTLDVTIRGVATTFAATKSAALFCTSSFCFSSSSADAKITVNSTTVVDAKTVVANITIASDAAVGYRNVTVVTNSETATESVVGPFLVTAPPPAIATLGSVTPGAAGVGETLNVTITGQATAFVDGTSVASFTGTGITINSTKVTSSTAATANITIASSATVGFRDVLVTTGSEVATIVNGFNVLAAPCSYSLSPTSTKVGVAATTGTVALTTQIGCPWTAASSATTVATITSAASGSSSATISYAVSANPGTSTRTATLTIGGQAFTITQTGPPVMALNRVALTFGAVSSGTAFTSSTAAQGVQLTQTGIGTVTWTAAASVPWLTVSPASGSGPATLTIGVQFGSGLAASQTGAINLAFTGASNTAGPINVTLGVVSSTAAASLPFGVVDTPVGDATVLAGSIAVTGWTLDNIGVRRVELWRDLQSGETTPPFASTPSDPRNGKVFIANATFVDGARPDVEALNTTTPFAYRAGWGYLLLTWGLWNQGNGTYKLYAFAFDQENNLGTIGTKTIIVSNSAATKPFGSIDTPEIGGEASGPNFGWGLTPKVGGVATCKIQPSGVQVSIDSGPLQPVVYGDARTDIAGAFTGFSNTAAAGGHYIFDWTTLTNGAHTIGWVITDDCSRADGVGSRFFNVSTGTSLTADPMPFAVAAPRSLVTADRSNEPESDAPITVARGYGELPVIVTGGESGSRTVELTQGERIEIRVPRGFEVAYQLVGDRQSRPLPIGSTWDDGNGIFYWQPAPAFLGRYRIVFSNGTERISVRLVVTP